MSQAKVDRYKEEKKNRAEIMKKEKREKFFLKCGAGIIGAALIVWVGFSGYQSLTSSDAANGGKTYNVNTDAMDEYLQELAETE